MGHTKPADTGTRSKKHLRQAQAVLDTLDAIQASDQPYTVQELQRREPYVEILAGIIAGGSTPVDSIAGEPKLPLNLFITKSTHEWLQSAHSCENCPDSRNSNCGGRYLEDLWNCRSDTKFAKYPGMRARDVFDARLARAALIANIVTAGDSCGFDHTEDGWDATVTLQHVFPRSGGTLDLEQLTWQARGAAMELAARAHAGNEYPACSTGEELLLWHAVTVTEADLESDGIGSLDMTLTETLFEDNDFLLLFDPRFDGIEDSPVADMMGMTITGPKRWFEKFR